MVMKTQKKQQAIVQGGKSSITKQQNTGFYGKGFEAFASTVKQKEYVEIMKEAWRLFTEAYNQSIKVNLGLQQ